MVKELDSDQFLKDLQGKNLNFLIGAGASAGIINTLSLPLPDNMSFEDLYTTVTDNSKKVLKLIWFFSWIKDTEILKFNSKDPTFCNYHRFINNIVNFLDRESYDKPKRANIFTTNYDSLFEVTFDEIAKEKRLVYFNDGSRGFLNRYISTENFNLNVSHSAVTDNFQRSIPTINLLKIHGSITWEKEDNTDAIKVKLNNEQITEINNKYSSLFNKLKKDYKKTEIAKTFFKCEPQNNKNNEVKITNLIKLDVELSKFYDDNSKEINNFNQEYSNLQVVNPNKEKFSETVFQQNYYQLIRMLSYELEKNNSILIVFGFSFADEHILEIIRRSIVNPYLKIYVICYKESDKESISKKLGDIGNNRIEYLPHIFNKIDDIDNKLIEIHGDFNYLNSLFDGYTSVAKLESDLNNNE